jgi:hypothetical protein
MNNEFKHIYKEVVAASSRSDLGSCPGGTKERHEVGTAGVQPERSRDIGCFTMLIGVKIIQRR